MKNKANNGLRLDHSEVSVIAKMRGIAVSDVDVNGLTNMRAQDSGTLANELQRTLDTSRSGQAPFPAASSEELAKFRRGAIRLLVKLSRHYDIFPTMLYVESVRCDQKLDPISRGGFADIFQGTIGEEVVAVKRIRAYVSDGDRNRIQDMLRKEVILWHQLEHPHILPLLGIDAKTFTPWYSLVSPWMKNGNLLDFLEKNATAPLGINQWIGQAAKGLQYLHEQNIVHGDLRAANVLINDAHQACLADFGLARVATVASTVASTAAQQSNARWLAPEMLAGDESVATTAGDVFALGRVCLEVHTLKMPFWYIQREAAVIAKIQAGEDVRRPTAGEKGFQGLSDPLWEALQKCWTRDPSKRLSVTAFIKLLERVTGSSSQGASTSSSSARIQDIPPEVLAMALGSVAKIFIGKLKDKYGNRTG